MEDEQDIFNNLLDEGLKPALKRDLSLFTSSCLGEGYTKLLLDISGINYNALGGISFNGDYQSLINEEFISKQVEKLIQEERLYSALKKADSIFEENLLDFRELVNKYNSDKNALYFLAKIIDLYPRYLASLGLYNAIYRYLNQGGSSLNKSEIEIIGKTRNVVASLYPEIENMVKICSTQICKTSNLEEDSLLYLTKNELLEYLTSGTLNQSIEDRKKSYFHLHIPTKSEIVVTNKELINKINKELFSQNIDYSIKDINGVSAYPGLVRGEARILRNNNKMTGGFVLVAVSTNPQHIDMIKNAMAIVTDEGGILSHAAIIARELKIPCVIGTKIATKIFKDGDLIEVDANSGIVRLLSRK